MGGGEAFHLIMVGRTLGSDGILGGPPCILPPFETLHIHTVLVCTNCAIGTGCQCLYMLRGLVSKLENNFDL